MLQDDFAQIVYLRGYPLDGMTVHWGVVSIILTKTPQIIEQIIWSSFHRVTMTDTGTEVSTARFNE